MIHQLVGLGMHTQCLIHNSIGQDVFVLSAFGNAYPIAGNKPKSPSRVAETALTSFWEEAGTS